MKILIAVDGSAYTRRMLAYLAAHEELWLQPTNRYTVIYVGVSVGRRAATMVGMDAVRDFQEKEAEAVFKPVRTFLKKNGVDATCVAKAGEAGELIARQAEQGRYDLVIMGTRGRSDLVNLVLGSVAQRVLARCKVPVLLVR